MTTPLVIDTDVALGVWHEGRPRDIDDGFAIVEAINIDTIDLRAVTTVYGNAPLADVDRVARELVALKDVRRAGLARRRDRVAATRSDAAPQRRRSRSWPSCCAPAPDDRRHRSVDEHGAARASLSRVHREHRRNGHRRRAAVRAGASISAMSVRCRTSISRTTCARWRSCSTREIPLVLAGFELTSQVVITDRGSRDHRRARHRHGAYLHAIRSRGSSTGPRRFRPNAVSIRGIRLPSRGSHIANCSRPNTRHVRIRAARRQATRAARMRRRRAAAGVDVLHGVRARRRRDVRRGNRRERLLNRRPTR